MKAVKVVLMCLALSLLVCASAAIAPDQVFDITGTSLQPGTDYYILPVFRGRGGGLTLASTKYHTCPLDVVQARQEVSNGLPVTFSPVNGKKAVVRVSTDLNIKFSVATICVRSTVWKLKGFDIESTQQWFVTTGGVEGKPGRETVNNWFKIEKHEKDYKLVFCPTVCDFCKVMCRDVGVFIDANGIRRLALSDVPFKVMFKRAA